MWFVCALFFVASGEVLGTSTRFTNIKCEVFDSTYCTYKRCDLKLMGRGVVALNVHAKLLKGPFNNAKVHKLSIIIDTTLIDIFNRWIWVFGVNIMAFVHLCLIPLWIFAITWRINRSKCHLTACFLMFCDRHPMSITLVPMK